MSGIIGFTLGPSLSLRNGAKVILQGMQSLISHKDFYVKDELFCDEYMCATRSSINILQKQPQPHYELGIHVWFDGEFYNQAELREEIDAPEGDDPGLLLSLFRRNGDFRFLKGIDGIYSAVIYDSVRQQLHLVTDSYGLRPLYWTVHKGCLVWGTEVKAMLALPGYAPRIDRQAVEEFFSIGYLIKDRTWFEDVKLVPSGTVLTWDLKQQTVNAQRYWWWDEIKPLAGKIDEREIAEELGRLFIDAVRRRSREGERVGTRLSGGCDSRAVLAAMPDQGYPICAVTFGKEDCPDIRISRSAAKVKGALHYIIHLNERNWFMARVNGVWWTDGQLDLMHMHGMEGLPQMKKLFDITLGGDFAGASLSGTYVRSKLSDLQAIESRVRRFMNMSNRIDQVYLESRNPFIDSNLMRFANAIPDRLRANGRIYHMMLLTTFPEFFRSIPWESTGVPISWPSLITRGIALSRGIKQRFLQELGRIGLPTKDPHSIADYTKWIRGEPARSFFQKLLNNPTALYLEYISRQRVLGDWERHLGGGNRADRLCRYLTFEIWLQQVFEGRYRLVEEE